MSEVNLLAALVRAVKATGAISEARLMTDCLPLVEAVLAGQGGCARTGRPNDVVILEEAMKLTGRSRSYFVYRSGTAGGRTRLEDWEAQGDARQVGSIWIISRSILEDHVASKSLEDSGGGVRLNGKAVLAASMPRPSHEAGDARGNWEERTRGPLHPRQENHLRLKFHAAFEGAWAAAYPNQERPQHRAL